MGTTDSGDVDQIIDHIIDQIIEVQLHLVHCVYNRIMFNYTTLTNFEAFFEEKSVLHSFCNVSSLTKNRLKSSSTCRESKTLLINCSQIL